MSADQPLGSEHLEEPIFGHLRRDYVSLNASLTVGQALEELRTRQLGEKIVYFYVVDDEERLVGVLPTRRLLMSGPDIRIASLMVTGVVTVPTWATVREASDLLLRHRFLALPVVDEVGRLHGIADVALFTRDQTGFAGRAVDDVFQLIGIHLTDRLGPWDGFRDRFPWLLANVAGGLLAAAVTSRYQALLDVIIVLALFIPVVLALAESVSIQSVTLTLQGLHGAGTSFLPRSRPLWKEAATAALLGAACGTLVGATAGIWQGSWLLAITIAGAITASMLTASLLGVVLPALLHWLRRDPNIAAGPIVLALADIATLVFYFNLAGTILDR